MKTPKLKLVTRAILAATFVASVISSVGCTRKNDSPNDGSAKASNSSEVLIGEYGSFTGSEATFGVNTSNGIKLAIAEWNEKGGVKGKKIVLKSLDDQGKSEEAASAITRLITQDHVVAVIGENASSRSLAAAPIAQQNKIPMISPSSTNPKVTEVGDYIFRVCFIDPFQGTVMAKFAHDTLKAKNVAVFVDVKSDYSVGLADFFKKTFKELGGTVSAEASYQGGDMDFKAQLTQLKASKPDAIFVPGYYTEVGLIARQARQLGITAPMMGGDGWDSAKLFEIGGAAIKGGFFSNHYTTDSTDTVILDFIKRYKAKYNDVPDGLAAMGYDAANVLIEAMSRTSDMKPEQIRDELAKTKDFAAVTGKITMDANRNPVKSAVVVKVDGAENKFVTTISP